MATARQMTFGSLLRAHRTAAGLTQEDLAERSGVSGRAISDLERGARTRPRRDTIALLADALHLPNDDRVRLQDAVFRSRKPPDRPTAGEAARSLPVEVTPLIGREREETAIVDLLQQPDVRLLCLTGTGGVGKTRLALRVAHLTAGAHADGVHVVLLASLRDTRHVIPAISTSLGLGEARGLNLRQVLENYLRPRSTLLLLDNFEHVLDAAPDVAELLASCPGLTVLVTSREPLHLYGEFEFVVPPLAAPPLTKAGVETHELSRYPASALFLSRAGAVMPMERLDDDEAAAVRDICVRLDGVPLAIELAAAQMKYASASQLLLRLRHRFEVLVDGPRDASSRQQTMRACVAWSYDLLTPQEQDALCRLAVFTDGCTLEAAEWVFHHGGTPHVPVTGTLHSLVDKSLLNRDRLHGEPPRFSIFETIREYALERLEELGRIGDAYSAYARYYLTLSENAESSGWGPEEAGWLRTFARERDNVRAVLAWALEHDVELGLRIAGALRRVWNHDGHFRERRNWIEQALAQSKDVDPAVRAKALMAAGWLALHEGDMVAAADSQSRAVSIARGLGDVTLLGNTLMGLAVVELGGGDTAPAIALCEESMHLFAEVGETRYRGSNAYTLGLASQLRGELDGARSYFEESIALLRSQGESISIGSSLRALGSITMDRKEYPQARAVFYEALQAAWAIRHREGIAMSLRGMAAALAALGEIEYSAHLWGAAEAMHEELHGSAKEGETPFASLPRLSPHLSALTPHFGEVRWMVGQAEGHAASIQETMALVRDMEHSASGPL